MKLTFAFILVAATLAQLRAQAIAAPTPPAGQVDYVAAAGNIPAFIQLRAGEIACNLTTSYGPDYAGSTPVRWAFLTCWIRGRQSSYSVPLANASITLSMHGSPSDSVAPETCGASPCAKPRDVATFTLTADDPAAPMKWDATATPAGGTTAHQMGTL